MKNILTTTAFILLSIFSYAQINPGGVKGVSVWYQVDYGHIGDEIFNNYSNEVVAINPCSEEINEGLFNYNFSLKSEELCLSFRKKIEYLTFQDFFLVGKNESENSNLSLIASEYYIQVVNNPIADNFVDLNSENALSKNFATQYTSSQNQFIYNYQHNHSDKSKLNFSYGRNGETEFTIGKEIQIDGLDYSDNNSVSFNGLIPEFLMFERKLTDNQNQRIQSYLAMKYGLTLNNGRSYLSSNNIITYNKSNLKKFSSRIFGLGRDDESGLNQLQSQSMHQENFLSVSIDSLEANNYLKKQNASISNLNFILNGDNNQFAGDFTEALPNEIKAFKRIWLAQFTGRDIRGENLTYTLNLSSSQISFLIENPDFNIWMLIDHLATEEEVSDFFDPMIEYHRGVVDFDEKTVTFQNLNMDYDGNGYDQYTFGISDRMMITAKPVGCAGEENDVVEIDVDSCSKRMSVTVRYTIEGEPVETTFTEYSSPFQMSFIPGVEYDVTVVCEAGTIGNISFNFDRIPIALDLGPDTNLSSINNQIIFDAGAGHSDADATYKWFKDGVQLPNDTPVLEVSEPGLYTCELTSSDLSCVLTDDVEVGVDPFQYISDIEICQGLNTIYDIAVTGGLGPFQLRLISPSGQTNHVFEHNLQVDVFEYGEYNVEIEDRDGNIQYDEFVIYEEVEASLRDQIVNIQDQSLTANGSLGILDLLNTGIINSGDESVFSLGRIENLYNEPEFSFKWKLNDNLISSDKILNLYAFNAYEPVNPPEWSDQCDIEFFGSEAILSYSIYNSITQCHDEYYFYLYTGDMHLIIDAPCEEHHRNADKNVIVDNDNYVKTSITTNLFPNPQLPDQRFIHELNATQVINGTLEIFSPKGQLIKTKTVEGKSNYRHSFKLNSSGVYLIRFTSSTGEVLTDRIVIK